MRKPSFDMKVFAERRARLASLIEGDALVLPAHPEYIRNNDVHHDYRQDSNLFYLTGFEEPESVFVFRPGRQPESVLFVRKKDPLRETWDGFRYGDELAKAEFQMDATFHIEDFEKEAAELLNDVDNVYYSLFNNDKFDANFKNLIAGVKAKRGRSGRGNLTIKDSYPLLGEMRMYKNDYEVETLRKACQISAEAHLEVMRYCHPGQNERALHGKFIHSSMERGASRLGYGAIVAGGNNANTLHYVFNDATLKDGDMLLIDAGAEFDYYTGDITRTYPVNGKFNDTQRRIYQLVLDVQKKVVDAVKPGASQQSLQNLAIDGLVDIMLEEKILKGSKDKIIESNEYKKFYPHGIGHWLGIDVHDAGTYEVNGEPRLLSPGNCLTIEPGLYISEDTPGVPEEVKGIGIRIEDNILVTEEGNENLTFAAPKEISDLESIIGKS